MVPRTLFEKVLAERDAARRAAHSLEGAINHHMRDTRPMGTDADDRLWRARDKIVDKWQRGEI